MRFFGGMGKVGNEIETLGLYLTILFCSEMISIKFGKHLLDLV